jgi:hypothetical protein
MVLIAPPPPKIPPDPNFHGLAAGSQIVRIFNPNKYGTQALTFRLLHLLHLLHLSWRWHCSPSPEIFYE